MISFVQVIQLCSISLSYGLKTLDLRLREKETFSAKENAFPLLTDHIKNKGEFSST